MKASHKINMIFLSWLAVLKFFIRRQFSKWLSNLRPFLPVARILMILLFPQETWNSKLNGGNEENLFWGTIFKMAPIIPVICTYALIEWYLVYIVYMVFWVEVMMKMLYSYDLTSFYVLFQQMYSGLMPLTPSRITGHGGLLSKFFPEVLITLWWHFQQFTVL